MGDRVYAEVSTNNKLIDPMVPKLLNAQKPEAQAKIEDSVSNDAEKLFNLSAIGYNNDKIYCVINGNLLSVNDTINGYKVKEIQLDEIILVDESGEIKKLVID